MARDKVLSTTQSPDDSTDIEGLEEYLKPQNEASAPPAALVAEASPPQADAVEAPVPAGKTDEELFRDCEDCHIADAVVKFHEIAEKCGDEVTVARINKELVGEPPPEQWMDELSNIAAEQSCGTEGYRKVMGELTGYLQGRDSPLLKKTEPSRST